MDKFREIQCFVTVVESGSFVKAADALEMSKASISRIVSMLETRLHTRLLQRTTRNLSLTDAGQVFHHHCKQILAELEELERSTRQSTLAPVGRLRVNAPQTFGVLYLAPLWEKFIQQYPGVQLDIDFADRLVDVVDEGYDVVVRIRRLPDSSLVSRQFTSTRIILCASPQYLAHNGTPATVEDIARHKVISYRYAADGNKWGFHTAHGIKEVRTNPWMWSNNGDTCCALAAAHQGLIRQPDFLLMPYLATGRLVEVLPEYPCGSMGIYAIYPSRQHLSMKVRAFVDFLVTSFSNEVQHQPPPP